VPEAEGEADSTVVAVVAAAVDTIREEVTSQLGRIAEAAILIVAKADFLVMITEVLTETTKTTEIPGATEIVDTLLVVTVMDILLVVTVMDILLVVKTAVVLVVVETIFEDMTTAEVTTVGRHYIKAPTRTSGILITC
jgi:hypothetical protein